MHVTFMVHVKTSSAIRLCNTFSCIFSMTSIVANANLCSHIILWWQHSSDLHIQTGKFGARYQEPNWPHSKEFKVVKQQRTTAADRRRLHIFTAFSDTKPSHSLSQQWSHTMRRLSDPMQLLASSHRLLRVNLDVSTDAHTPTRSLETAIQEAAKRYWLQFH